MSPPGELLCCAVCGKVTRVYWDDLSFQRLWCCAFCDARNGDGAALVVDLDGEIFVGPHALELSQAKARRRGYKVLT